MSRLGPALAAKSVDGKRRGPQGFQGLWGDCVLCSAASDVSEMLVCSDKSRPDAWGFSLSTLSSSDSTSSRRSRSRTQEHEYKVVAQQRLEDLMQELFQLHDLNDDGLLEEFDLVQLNQQIALLHHGGKANVEEVKAKYCDLFRSRFDPEGRPVAYGVFREYAREVLLALDDDPEAQEMILEQFVCEAQSGRDALDLPVVLRTQVPPDVSPECPRSSVLYGCIWRENGLPDPVAPPKPQPCCSQVKVIQRPANVLDQKCADRVISA